MKEYDHAKIEKKWQKEWEAKKTYKTLSAAAAKGKKPYYVLDMFPYPSGAGLHVGHPRGYIGSDVVARRMRMEGCNVLHPMGYDAFGLPAEQYAIANKIHPRKAVEENVKTFERQLSIIGLSYDWSRKINTTDPAYYKWTQWIFLQIYDSWFDTEKKKARPIGELVSIFAKAGNRQVPAYGTAKQTFSREEWKAMSEIEKQNILMDYRLAYEGYSEVNWCPELGTVLANDEIVDGKDGPVSERGGYPVEKKSMRQWFMRITAYGERLIDGLEGLDWPEHIKEIERNWIGKSEGSEIDFKIAGLDESITVFTTRADTIFGATYVVVAPEHVLIPLLSDKIQNWSEVESYIAEAKKKDDIMRTTVEKEKTGVVLQGIFVINPANQEKIPVYIADYVLYNYATGAVMAVPAHDERDFEFANKYNLKKRCVIYPASISIQGNNFDPSFDQLVEEERRKFLNSEKPYLGNGHLINSGDQFNGLTQYFAIRKIVELVKGETVTKFKFRDAIFARQRYWGEPIPLSKDKAGIIHEMPESKLPLELPRVASYEPSGSGESPLASVSAWTKRGYETNTMPGWAGSAWYFLRYTDPANKKAFAGKKELAYWFDQKRAGGVDVYVGGAEHATGHLLYSRFWHKVLFDLGHVPTAEPFQFFRNQGMILASDGRKMSKRWGNVVNPDDIVATYGADTLRLYEMFMGPFSASQPWQTDSIIGPRRFIERAWKFAQKIMEQGSKNTDADAERVLHQTIQKVSEDIPGFAFNTAVSSMMICLNEMEKAESVSKEDYKKFLQILAPFAPHVTEELWSFFGEKKSIHVSGWPKYDAKKLVSDSMTIVVQVNSKNKAEITVPRDSADEYVKAVAQKDPKVAAALAGAVPKKIIYVPGRLVNIVA